MPITICNVYKPPHAPIISLTKALQKTLFLNSPPIAYPIICAGDFNTNNETNNATYNKLNVFFSSYDISQHILAPTNNHASTIDHIWTMAILNF